MHFDVLIKTPIIVFPRMSATDEPERDTLTAELGEIYANNHFLPLGETEDKDIANKKEHEILHRKYLLSAHVSSFARVVVSPLEHVLQIHKPFFIKFHLKVSSHFLEVP